MKRYFNLLLLLLALFTAGACSETGKDRQAGETPYTCPMHPQVVQPGPGTCPICHMDLVPQSGESSNLEISQDLAFLLRPANGTVVAGIATTRPRHKAQDVTLQLEGLISYDPRQVYSVPARVGGRIERLYVQYNFQPVRKGQKLLELYSPDLVAAQQELLYLVASAPEDVGLQQAARQKLRLLGASEAQIRQLLRSRKPSYSFALYSPYDGYVTGLNTDSPAAASPAAASPAPAAGGMAGMGSAGPAAAGPAPAPTPAAPAGLPLREGMYVGAGQPLLRVVNPRHLWAEFSVPAAQLPLLRKKAPVQLSFPQLPGKQLPARIDFLQPYYQAGEDFAKVRVYLPGQAAGLRVGQLVSARVSTATEAALWVPQAAVLDIGTRSVVFQKTGSVFEPVAVQAGESHNGQTRILGGLPPETEIAANAQFLVDSESFIQVKKEKAE
ncbi:MAG: efflux RND transporter periplasmic adaptor subunit [Adhaeribacter sp.]